jgi:hypothetical protein
MSEDDADTLRRQAAATEHSAPVTTVAGALILHALLAAFIGFQGWKMTLGFSVMGADSMSDFYAIHIFYLLVFGISPALDLLAVIHLQSRPTRARRYLIPALVVAWIQAACGMLLAIPAVIAGFALPLFIAVPYAFMVGVATRAARNLDHGGRSGGWRLASVDLAVFTGINAVIAIPVVLFDNQYQVF